MARTIKSSKQEKLFAWECDLNGKFYFFPSLKQQQVFSRQAQQIIEMYVDKKGKIFNSEAQTFYDNPVDAIEHIYKVKYRKWLKE